MRIIGVVNDSKLRQVTESPQPYVFCPILQSPTLPLVLNVRTSRPAVEMVSAIRAALAGLPAPSATQIQPLSMLVAAQTAPWRRAAATLSVFALVAVTLSAFGTYSLAQFTVASRHHELATRLALGSTVGRAIGMLMGQRLRDTAIGCTLGVSLFVVIVDRLSHAVHLLGGHRLEASVVAAGLLGVVVLGSTLAASRSVSRMEPATILRSP